MIASGRCRLLLASAAIFTAGLLLSAAPAAAAQSTPQLKISVDDGRDSALVGDVLDYTITITNTGTDDVSGLLVTQSLPAGLALQSTDGGAVSSADQVTWTTDLAAGQDAAFTSSVTVTSTGDGMLRLASVACAAVSADGPPIVCAADSDLLPAAAAVAEPNATAGTTDQIDSRWYVGAGSGIVIVAGLLALLLRQRRRDKQDDRQSVG